MATAVGEGGFVGNPRAGIWVFDVKLGAQPQIARTLFICVNAS